MCQLLSEERWKSPRSRKSPSQPPVALRGCEAGGFLVNCDFKGKQHTWSCRAWPPVLDLDAISDESLTFTCPGPSRPRPLASLTPSPPSFPPSLPCFVTLRIDRLSPAAIFLPLIESPISCEVAAEEAARMLLNAANKRPTA